MERKRVLWREYGKRNKQMKDKKRTDSYGDYMRVCTFLFFGKFLSEEFLSKHGHDIRYD